MLKFWADVSTIQETQVVGQIFHPIELALKN